MRRMSKLFPEHVHEMLEAVGLSDAPSWPTRWEDVLPPYRRAVLDLTDAIIDRMCDDDAIAEARSEGFHEGFENAREKYEEEYDKGYAAGEREGRSEAKREARLAATETSEATQ
jgi:flagellar biosynthesis/type III secretory pathway protein FliH